MEIYFRRSPKARKIEKDLYPPRIQRSSGKVTFLCPILRNKSKKNAVVILCYSYQNISLRQCFANRATHLVCNRRMHCEARSRFAASMQGSIRLYVTAATQPQGTRLPARHPPPVGVLHNNWNNTKKMRLPIGKRRFFRCRYYLVRRMESASVSSMYFA